MQVKTFKQSNFMNTLYFPTHKFQGNDVLLAYAAGCISNIVHDGRSSVVVKVLWYKQKFERSIPD
jgi:hypothetical protein